MPSNHHEAIPDLLVQFFAKHPRIALAFSGGTDSAYLMYAAKACGANVHAYYVNTQFQPAFELADARRLADDLAVPITVIDKDILCNEAVAANPADRCYYCKNALFSELLDIAHADGYTELMDGTNASDDAGDRPGMRALAEMQVLSPLRLCGITKAQVRSLSKLAGLFTWNKPAYACLATRIPTGTPLTSDTLHNVERAEDAMFALGFSDFRVRVAHGAAKLQLPARQFPQALDRRDAILSALSPLFPEVTLDLQPREGD